MTYNVFGGTLSLTQSLPLNVEEGVKTSIKIKKKTVRESAKDLNLEDVFTASDALGV